MSAASEPAAARDGEGQAPAPLTRITLTYRLLRFASRLFFLLSRRRYEGREHLPAEGGVLLVANHQSFLDIPLLAAATDRHVCFVARDSLAKSKVMAFIMRECGAVLVRRGQADRAALRAMTAHLQAGDCVAIFPEGTRSPDGRVGEFRAGALLVARQAGVPIVPTGIRGTMEALNRDAKLPLPRRAAVRYAAPVDPTDPEALVRTREAVVEMVGDGRFRSVAPL